MGETGPCLWRRKRGLASASTGTEEEGTRQVEVTKLHRDHHAHHADAAPRAAPTQPALAPPPRPRPPAGDWPASAERVGVDADDEWAAADAHEAEEDIKVRSPLPGSLNSSAPSVAAAGAAA
jgi:hypothetical protein